MLCINTLTYSLTYLVTYLLIHYRSSKIGSFYYISDVGIVFLAFVDVDGVVLVYVSGPEKWNLLLLLPLISRHASLSPVTPKLQLNY